MSEIQSRVAGAKPAGEARGLQGMRDILRGTLGRSLRGMEDESRLAAAWTVACGRALAGRGTVVGYAGGVVRVEVEDGLWLSQMISIRAALARTLAEASGLPVHGVDFVLKGRHIR